MWGDPKRLEGDDVKSLVVLIHPSTEVVFIGPVKFEGSWLWGRQTKGGLLEAYPSRRVVKVLQLPEVDP